MPGHMLGRGACPELKDLMGEKALQADITQVLDMDDIHRPQSFTKAAQELAAECFGAEQTWFLINGSTCGNQAMLMASLQPGEEVILPRCAHRSLQAGLIFSGAVPRYAASPYDRDGGVNLAVEAEELERLQKLHPRVKVWAVTAATPYGACADMKKICDRAHSCGAAVLADEAWGPHFGACEGLPLSAMAQGADCAVQSAHKLLGALSQASLLHYQGGRVDRGRLHLALRMLQSTSPSYLLLASLDLARRQLALEGQELWSKALERAMDLRAFVSGLPGFRVMEKGRAYDYDLTRVVISALDLGIDGVQLERILRYRFKVQPEMSDMRNVVLVVTPSQTEEDLRRLKAALQEISASPYDWIAKEGVKMPLKLVEELGFPGFPEMVLSPREAFFTQTLSVPWKEAIGKVCGELITPYPPGIPLICPGERIEAGHFAYLQELNRVGIPIDGLQDRNFEKVKILKV